MNAAPGSSFFRNCRGPLLHFRNGGLFYHFSTSFLKIVHSGQRLRWNGFGRFGRRRPGKVLKIQGIPVDSMRLYVAA